MVEFFPKVKLLIALILNIVILVDAHITLDPTIHPESPSYTFSDHAIFVVGNPNQYSIQALDYEPKKQSEAVCNTIVANPTNTTAPPIYTGTCETNTTNTNQVFSAASLSKTDPNIETGAISIITFFTSGQVDVNSTNDIWAGFTGEDQMKVKLRKGNITTIGTKLEGKGGIGVQVSCFGEERFSSTP